jgi:hypothetical protein
MRHHDIKIRQFRVQHRIQVRERAFDEPHIRQTGTGSEPAGELHVRGVEVEPPDIRVRAGRGYDKGGDAIATPHIGIAEWFREVRRTVAEQQAGHCQPVRRDLSVKVASIDHVADAAIIPLNHSGPFLA